MGNLSISVADARAQFSKIASMVNESGESVTVFRNSKPWVKIAPVIDEYVDALDNGLKRGFADYNAGRFKTGKEIDSMFEEIKQRNRSR